MWKKLGAGAALRMPKKAKAPIIKEIFDFRFSYLLMSIKVKLSNVRNVIVYIED